MPELRERGQDRLCGYDPDAGERLHEAALMVERLVTAGERADFFFDKGKLAFQRSDLA